MIDITSLESLNDKDFKILSEYIETQRREYSEIILRLEKQLSTEINNNKIIYNQYKKLVNKYENVK